jgi:hypothetical protein
MIRFALFTLALATAGCDRATEDMMARNEPMRSEPAPAADINDTARADFEAPDPANAGETSAPQPESGLPDTASALPLAGLVALLSLAGAAALRARR